MVLSFASEAHLQTGINVYMRERNRVSRLVDAGRILAEVVLSDYANVSEWSEDEDADKLFEDDRWYKEKRDLKSGRPCVIGPILVDEENPESGLVVRSSGSGVNWFPLKATSAALQLHAQLLGFSEPPSPSTNWA